jgi:hypothetical protein
MSETNNKDFNKVKSEWRPNPKQAEFLALPHSIKEGAYLGGAGSGKAICLDTIIPVENGYKQIRDIHPGDLVYNHYGQLVQVLAESEIFTDHKCFEITFDNNLTIKCDAEHKWIVHKNQENRNKRDKYQFLTTQQIVDSNERWSITVSEPLQKLNYDCPLDPYTLGVWLGDGNSHDPKFTSVDLEIVNKVSSKYNISDYGYGYSYRILGITKILEELNLIKNKHIPNLYFNLDFECRLALFQGLMDTDGTISSSGTGIELSISDEILAKDCLKLIYSLGIKASFTINKSCYQGKNYKDRYRIKFATSLPVFSLRRKAERHEGRKTGFNTERTNWHYIQSIKEIESIQVKCIQVYGGIYLVTEACIPTHNSDVLLMYGILNRWHENPLWKQVFMRRTFPELKNEILGRSRDIYSKFGASFNKTDMIWTFPRMDQYGAGMNTNAGAQIFLGHCEHDTDVSKYDSMQIPLFTPDEITSYSEFIYLYIAFERNRSPQGTGLPSITRAAGMPGGIGHTWVKKRFIDPYKPGGKIIVGKGGNKRIFIHATYQDNAEHIDPTYGQALDGRPEAERKAKKFGDFDAYLGQVFDEFRDRHYPDEPLNALHVVPPFEIPEYWPKFIVIDWGFRAMCYVGFFAVSPDKRLYLYKELTWTKTKIAEWASIVKAFMDKNIRFIKVCKSAGQDRGQEHTIQSEIEKELDHPVELMMSNPGARVAGKTLFHEYLRWTPKPQPKIGTTAEYSDEYAMYIYRTKGEEDYQNYLKQFDPPTTEDNIPKYQIFCCDQTDHTECTNCCPEAINAIKACNYAENKGDTPAEDVAQFHGDDPYDAQRYAIDSAEQLFLDSKDEFDKYIRQSRLEQLLKQTGDWTAFYRTIEHMDKVRPLRIAKVFHRRH